MLFSKFWNAFCDLHQKEVKVIYEKQNLTIGLADKYKFVGIVSIFAQNKVKNLNNFLQHFKIQAD